MMVSAEYKSLQRRNEEFIASLNITKTEKINKTGSLKEARLVELRSIVFSMENLVLEFSGKETSDLGLFYVKMNTHREVRSDHRSDRCSIHIGVRERKVVVPLRPIVVKNRDTTCLLSFFHGLQ